jgi:hypothetical protein
MTGLIILALARVTACPFGWFPVMMGSIVWLLLRDPVGQDETSLAPNFLKDAKKSG